MSSYTEAHVERLRREVTGMVAEVPLYKGYPAPGEDLEAWLAALPKVSKKELRKGFPKSLVRSTQNLASAMREEKVTLLATSGTTSDRLQVLWEWTWWDPQEREAMRLNARIANSLARPGFREAVLTTPSCGGGVCHLGSQTVSERTIDGMLFFNQSPDPSHWTEHERERMLGEWRNFSPRGVEADPAYLAMLCRAARQRKVPLPAPEFIVLTYETTTAAQRREISRTVDAPLYQLYGATEAGALMMECERGLLHINEQHAHLEFLPLGDRLARVVVTTIDKQWMPLLRYDIGDVVRLSNAEECACGRPANGPLIERVEGRASDCISIDHKLITPLMIDDVITSSGAEIAQWQLSKDVLQIVGEGIPRAAAAVSGLLGKTIRGEVVQAIAPEASGKYRLVRE